MIRTDAHVAPGEQPVLRDGRCRDVARQAIERFPHTGPRVGMPPPTQAMGFAPDTDPHRVDAFLHPTERFLIQRRVACRHRPAEVDDPLTRRPAGQVHSVHPRLQNVRVESPVGIRRQTEPLAGLIAWDIEGTALLVSDERHAGICRQASSPREIDAGRVSTCREIGVDLIDGLTVEPSAGQGRVVRAREADQRHSHGGAIVDPWLVAPRFEDPMAVRCGRVIATVTLSYCECRCLHEQR